MRRSASSTARASRPPPEARAKSGELAAGHCKVGQAADARVEDGVVAAALTAQRADHREGAEVDALEAQTGTAHRGDHTVDHVAAGRDEQHALARAIGGLDALHGLPVQDGLLQGHRDDVLRLEAHRGVELLAVLDDRKIDRTHGELLVGHADANAPVQTAVVAVKALERCDQRIDILDLAVTHDARLERYGGRTLNGDAATRNAHLGGVDADGIDVEADERLLALCHVMEGSGSRDGDPPRPPIGVSSPRLNP